MRMSIVCAVVLTYNRRTMLDQCLTALVGQSRVPDRILVLDNASTDGTAPFIRREWGERVQLVSLPRNVGAAGGFRAALHDAFETDADHVWMMDDDVLPDRDALERLLAADETLAGQGVRPSYLVSRARGRSGALTDVPDLDRRANAIGFQNWPLLLDHGMVPTRGATFVSILLPRATVEEHGLPLADMFMWGEDREYTVRISRERPGFLVGGSTVLHARATEGQLDIRTERNPERIRYHYFMVRNTTFTTRRYERKRQLIYLLIRQTRLAAGMATRGRWHGAALILRGLLHGFLFQPAT